MRSGSQEKTRGQEERGRGSGLVQPKAAQRVRESEE